MRPLKASVERTDVRRNVQRSSRWKRRARRRRTNRSKVVETPKPPSDVAAAENKALPEGEVTIDPYRAE